MHTHAKDDVAVCETRRVERTNQHSERLVGKRMPQAPVNLQTYQQDLSPFFFCYYAPDWYCSLDAQY